MSPLWLALTILVTLPALMSVASFEASTCPGAALLPMKVNQMNTAARTSSPQTNVFLTHLLDPMGHSSVFGLGSVGAPSPCGPQYWLLEGVYQTAPRATMRAA